MKPEKINRAVAECIGATEVDPPRDGLSMFAYWPMEFMRCIKGTKSDERPGFWFARVPNFFADLNACREMEENLDDDPSQGVNSEWMRYRAFLISICVRDELDVIHASAPQRCEAFLRVKGKWIQ